MKCHEALRPKHKVDPKCVETEQTKCELEDDMICEGAICKPVFPKCASDKEINDYVSTKTLTFRTINNHVNLALDDNPEITESEQILAN